MQMVLNESVRGLSAMVELNLDRILVPLAILVALAAGTLLGAQLIDVITPEMAPAQV